MELVLDYYSFFPFFGVRSLTEIMKQLSRHLSTACEKVLKQAGGQSACLYLEDCMGKSRTCLKCNSPRFNTQGVGDDALIRLVACIDATKVNMD